MTFSTSSALVVAHPGHEIRLHGWLEQTRPLVLILTDGTGRNSPSRIAAAAHYLNSINVPAGPLFGRATDQTIYEALLRQDFQLFIALVNELADVFVRERINFVVGDAIEGYNTTHDAFRLVRDAAIRLAERRRGRSVADYDFPVVGLPADCPPSLRARAIWLNLSDEVFARKLAAARRYYPALVAEVTDAFAHTGDGPLRRFLDLSDKSATTDGEHCLEMFRVEVLRPCLRSISAAPYASPTARPFYELHGERQAAAGHYRQVIRYDAHIRPLAAALAAHVAAETDEAAESSHHQPHARQARGH